MRHLPPLTGIRFIAVSMIFLFHNNVPVYGRFLQAVFHQFYLGVNVFFVLSGFLICYNYGKSVAINKHFLQPYYINRLGRIMPLYFVLVTFTFIVLHFQHQGGTHLLGVYLLNLTFIKGFSQRFLFTGIYTTWSLTAEMTFYFLFPFIYILMSRFNWWLKQVLLFWGIGLILYLLFYFFPFKGFFQDLYFVITATFFGRCFEFFLGMKLALLFTSWQVKTHVDSSKPKPAMPIYSISGGIAAIVIIAIQAIISPEAAAQRNITGLILSLLCFPIAVTVLFFGILTETTWFNKLLSSSLFQVLGKCSYALFLVHGSIIAEWVFSFWQNNQLLSFISLTIISIALYYLLENPVNRWIKGYTNKLKYTNN